MLKGLIFSIYFLVSVIGCVPDVKKTMLKNEASGVAGNEGDSNSTEPSEDLIEFSLNGFVVGDGQIL